MLILIFCLLPITKICLSDYSVCRYCELEDPMARRHQQLDDSLKLHQFLHDVEDEQTWMREREPLASDTDLGNTLTSVQILLKKHKVYMHQKNTYFYIVFSIHYTILCLLSDIVEQFLVHARVQII